MTPDQRKKLEEMARNRHGAGYETWTEEFMAGAEAAWDMATKAGVNEGIDAVLRLAPYWKNVSTPQIVDDILELRRSINPAPRRR